MALENLDYFVPYRVMTDNGRCSFVEVQLKCCMPGREVISDFRSISPWGYVYGDFS